MLIVGVAFAWSIVDRNPIKGKATLCRYRKSMLIKMFAYPVDY